MNREDMVKLAVCNLQECVPTVLVIDDLFGRPCHNGRNVERKTFCQTYHLQDITPGGTVRSGVKDPIAKAWFCRGQSVVPNGSGYTVENSTDEVLDLLRRSWLDPNGEVPRFAMVILDLCFLQGRVQEPWETPAGIGTDQTECFGWRIFDAILEEFGFLGVIINSAQPEDDSVQENYTKRGADIFLKSTTTSDGPSSAKPHEVLAEVLWERGLFEDATESMAQRFVGQSRPILEALRQARKAASVVKPAANARGDLDCFLIRGESGTGKTHLVQFIHNHSSRRGGPFIKQNIAQVTDTLVESVLFGVSKDASIVNAPKEDQPGLLELANNGTLFLDEIGRACHDVQAKLLTVLQNGEYRPLGPMEPEPRRTNACVIFATCQSVESGARDFLPDLYNRMASKEIIRLPSLDECPEDIETIVRWFVSSADNELGVDPPHRIAGETINMLRCTSWRQGNLHRLQGVVRGAVKHAKRVGIVQPIHVERAMAEKKPSDKMGISGAGEAPQPASTDNGPQKATTPGPRGIQAIVDAVRKAELGHPTKDELRGALPDLEDAYACLLAKLLAAVAEAEKRPSGNDPLGNVIAPMARLLTNDHQLTKKRPNTICCMILRMLTDEARADLLNQNELLDAVWKRVSKERGKSGRIYYERLSE